MLLGLISDTHGLLRPEAVKALRGVDLIVHAGDVGDPTILVRLKEIAPLFAIRGNVDTQPWAMELPATTVVQADGAAIYVLHNLRELDLNPKAAGFSMIVSGHTHKAEQHVQEGVLFLNPGSAGPKRFDLQVTLATLDMEERPWKAEIIALVK